MELKWLEDFLSLSRFMNFSLAAKDRNITQSALSRRIKQLEEWVGAPLFDRSTYPVTLTSSGETFLGRARETLEMLLALKQETLEQHTPDNDVLSFATLSTLVLTFFPVWMERIEADGSSFRTRFADAHATFAGNVSTLIDSECDFLLTYAHDCVSTLKDLAGFPYLKLGSERVVAVSAPAADGRPLHSLLNPGKPVDYLSYRNSSFFAQALPKAIFEKASFRLNTVYENAMSAALKAMAVSGHGVAWIPESLAIQELQSGQLVPAGDTSLDMLVEIRLYRSCRLRCKAAAQFWERASEIGNLTVLANSPPALRVISSPAR